MLLLLLLFSKPATTKRTIH